MKRLSILLLTIMLLVGPGTSWADGLMINSYKYVSSGSGSVLLCGNNSVQTMDTQYAQDPGYVCGCRWTAVATGTAAKGYCRLQGSSGSGNAKMIIANGTTGAIIAVSSAAAYTTSAALIEFTFSSGSIVSGTQYIIAYIADGYTYATYTDNETGAWIYSTNNYTTPTTIDIGTPDTADMEIYVKS